MFIMELVVLAVKLKLFIMEGKPLKANLLLWYRWNKSFIMTKENKFWLIWVKNRLFKKRLHRIY